MKNYSNLYSDEEIDLLYETHGDMFVDVKIQKNKHELSILRELLLKADNLFRKSVESHLKFKKNEIITTSLNKKNNHFKYNWKVKIHSRRESYSNIEDFWDDLWLVDLKYFSPIYECYGFQIGNLELCEDERVRYLVIPNNLNRANVEDFLDEHLMLGASIEDSLAQLKIETLVAFSEIYRKRQMNPKLSMRKAAHEVYEKKTAKEIDKLYDNYKNNRNKFQKVIQPN